MIVEVRYLYCHPRGEGKLVQAKYFGKLRDRTEIAECSVQPVEDQSWRRLRWRAERPAPRQVADRKGRHIRLKST
jgi:hypothetical protein